MVILIHNSTPIQHLALINSLFFSPIITHTTFPTVTVKWTKHTYTLECYPNLAEFKLQLEHLTNVPIDRQKLVFKGKNVDDAAYAALPEKAMIMMIGSAAVIHVVDEAKKAGPQEEQIYLPPGLQNLGNTCWLNSTLKALYHIPELRTALIAFAKEHEAGVHTNHSCSSSQCVKSPMQQQSPSVKEIAFVTQVGLLFASLEAKIAEGRHMGEEDNAMTPTSLLMALSQVYPDLFNPMAQQHEQQDSDEFLTLFFATLDKILITKDPDANKYHHLIQDLFGLEVEQITKPADLEKLTKAALTNNDSTEMKDDAEDNTEKNKKLEELATLDTTTQFDSQTKLRCTVQQDVIDIKTGIKLALQEELTKMSKISKQNEQFVRQSFVVKLPKYLIIHLQRFHWKADTNSRAKLIRKVAIDVLLDLFPLCNEETQHVLAQYRRSFEDIRKEMGLETKETTATTTTAEVTSTEPTEEQKTKNIAKFGNVQNGGYYELSAIITHQGRSADSGHYVAWTKTAAGKSYNEKALVGMTDKEKEVLKEQMTSKSFIKHDDDHSTFAPERILTDLAGGGEFHMAYICVYKSQENAKKL